MGAVGPEGPKRLTDPDTCLGGEVGTFELTRALAVYQRRKLN